MTRSNSLSLEWGPSAKVEYLDVAGTRIRHLVSGRGRPVLLLHTLRTQMEMFHKIIKPLSENFEVHAVDLPGHGQSDIPVAVFDADYFHTFTLQLLGTLGRNGIIVAGESIGASIALRLASETHPALGGVVALNPYDYAKGLGVGRSSPIARILVPVSLIPGLGEFAMFLRPRFVVDSVLLGGVADKTAIPRWLLDILNAVAGRPGYNRAFLSLLRNAGSWEKARVHYGATGFPVQILWGRKDWSTPVERTATQHAMGYPECRTVEDAGHFLALDGPDAVVEAIETISERAGG